MDWIGLDWGEAEGRGHLPSPLISLSFFLSASASIHVISTSASIHVGSTSAGSVLRHVFHSQPHFPHTHTQQQQQQQKAQMPFHSFLSFFLACFLSFFHNSVFCKRHASLFSFRVFSQHATLLSKASFRICVVWTLLLHGACQRPRTFDKQLFSTFALRLDSTLQSRKSLNDTDVTLSRIC